MAKKAMGKKTKGAAPVRLDRNVAGRNKGGARGTKECAGGMGTKK